MNRMSAITALVCVVALSVAASAESTADLLDLNFLSNPRAWMCRDDAACLKSFDSMPLSKMGEMFLTRMGDAAADVINSNVDPLPGMSHSHPDKAELIEFASKARMAMKAQPHVSQSEVVKELLREKHTKGDENVGSAQYPYFSFIPQYYDSLHPGPSAKATFSTPCFDTVTITAGSITPQRTSSIIMLASGQKSILCADHFMFGINGAIKTVALSSTAPVSFELDLNGIYADPMKLWYFQSRGLKILRFQNSILGMLGDIVKTVEMMIGFASSPISNTTFNANVDFLNNYVFSDTERMGPKVRPRSALSTVAEKIDPSVISAGDAMFVLRPDGLDPMISWGEGSDVGHTVLFMRNGTNNENLYVCESTTKDAYWPTDGVQCHSWEDWYFYATKAEYNVVWVPLDPKHKEYFNISAAWDFFHSMEGNEYGYQVFLYGWLDQVTGNDPCLPPDFKTYCLVPPTTEFVLNFIDELMGDKRINIVRQGALHRLGLWEANKNGDMTMMQILKYASEEKNMNIISDIYTIPEQDAWNYNTTRHGVDVVSKAQVCCVYVCNMWKHAGVFRDISDQINCGEQTLWDLYSMKIFDATKMNAGRPEICKTTDPTNQLCQMTGSLTLHLEPDVNTRQLYPWMGQNCSSSAPAYKRDPGC